MHYFIISTDEMFRFGHYIVETSDGVQHITLNVSTIFNAISGPAANTEIINSITYSIRAIHRLISINMYVWKIIMFY